MKHIELTDEEYEQLIRLFDKEIGDMQLAQVEMKARYDFDVAKVYESSIKSLQALKAKVEL